MNPIPRKQRKKEQRRSEIIDTAERLFYAKGFDNVTMEEIAEEVDLSKGSLYLHFRNKDSLFLAIVARRHGEWVEILAGRLSDLETGGEKLRAIIRWYVDIARANPEYNEMATTYGPLIWSRMESGAEIPGTENVVRYNLLLSDAVRAGIEDGTIRDDLDPTVLGMYLTLISISVTSPLPAWKNGFGLAGVTFDQFLDSFSRFIEPSIDGSSQGRTG